MLLFKKQYFEAIRQGHKTATLRYWTFARVKTGKTYTIPRCGRVEIDSIQPTDWEQLTNQDARDDGFESLEELRRALNKHYTPEQQQKRCLYQIRFRFIDD